MLADAWVILCSHMDMTWFLRWYQPVLLETIANRGGPPPRGELEVPEEIDVAWW